MSRKPHGRRKIVCETCIHACFMDISGLLCHCIKFRGRNYLKGVGCDNPSRIIIYFILKSVEMTILPLKRCDVNV